MGRKRIRDKTNLGPSKLVPYKAGESPKKRHARRLAVAMSHEKDVRAWCEEKHVSLKIHNGGHHWMFQRGGCLVEWWPSSAKLVVNKQWKKGYHVHDYTQLLPVLASQYRETLKHDDAPSDELPPF